MKSTAWFKAIILSAALLPLTSSFAATIKVQVPLEEEGAWAEPAHGARFHKSNPEVRAYVQQHVLPVVRQQRQKLEAQLSAADKTQLDTYRAQLKELRQQGKALRQSFAPAGQRPVLTEAQREQLQQHRAARRAVMQNVAQLAQKYETQIAQLALEVKPQHERWATDLQALRAKNSSSELPGQHHGRRGHHGKGRNFFGPSRFLLMRPAAAVERMPDTSGEQRAALYPNPASSTQRLEYTVPKEGNVKVELLDERGKTLRTVFDGKQAVGTQSLDVNVAELPRGTYFYKITSKGNNETRRFLKD
jgi:hypothetical protein